MLGAPGAARSARPARELAVGGGGRGFAACAVVPVARVRLAAAAGAGAARPGAALRAWLPAVAEVKAVTEPAPAGVPVAGSAGDVVLGEAGGAVSRPCGTARPCWAADGGFGVSLLRRVVASGMAAALAASLSPAGLSWPRTPPACLPAPAVSASARTCTVVGRSEAFCRGSKGSAAAMGFPPVGRSGSAAPISALSSPACNSTDATTAQAPAHRLERRALSGPRAPRKPWGLKGLVGSRRPGEGPASWAVPGVGCEGMPPWCHCNAAPRGGVAGSRLTGTFCSKYKLPTVCFEAIMR